MATNRKFADKPKTRRYPVASNAVAGDPLCIGGIPCVLLTSYEAHDGCATVQLDGSFTLDYSSKDSGGVSGADRNVVGAVGDIVYYNSGDTPVLSARAGGTRFGYLAETATSGQHATKVIQIGY